MRFVLTTLAVVFVLATVLPLARHTAWWIRIFDFPRAQIAVAGLVVTCLFAFFRDASSPAEDVIFAALVLSIAYQSYKMRPYTVLARHQVHTADAEAPGEDRLSLLIANVYMDNREAGCLLKLVEETDPDLILALETDQWWTDQLSVLTRDYPHVIGKPLPNAYGILLHSRLELIEPSVKFLVEDFVPSIHARVRLKEGVEVALHGLHPRPPVPTEDVDSIERDAEILIIGRHVQPREQPTIVMGDLNDVAWSHTTSLFQRISGLLDPRIGRGMYNTFHAKIPLLRCPLDHLFHSQHFKLIELRRLPNCGSDHFPILVRLQYAPANDQERPQLESGDRRQAKEKIDEANDAK